MLILMDIDRCHTLRKSVDYSVLNSVLIYGYSVTVYELTQIKLMVRGVSAVGSTLDFESGGPGFDPRPECP